MEAQGEQGKSFAEFYQSGIGNHLEKNVSTPHPLVGLILKSNSCILKHVNLIIGAKVRIVVFLFTFTSESSIFG